MIHVPKNLKALGLAASILLTDAALPSLSAAELAEAKSGDVPVPTPAEQKQLSPGMVKVIKAAIPIVGGLYIAASVAAGVAQIFYTVKGSDKKQLQK